MDRMVDRRSVLVGAAALAFGARGARAADPVRVGSKLDAEGALLGSMILQLIESAGIPTVNRTRLGPTKIVRAALVSGEIDIYPEYTGNAGFFHNVDGDPAWKNAAQAAAKAAELDAKNDIVWLKAAPANNTWAIAVRQDLARTNNLSSMEDLARYVNGGGTFKLAASAEFVESPAALPAFQGTYGFALKADQLLVLAGGDTAVTIRAAAERTSGVNAAMVYGTDGAIAVLGLAVLVDTKGAQAVYEPAPTIRKAVLDANPRIRTLIDPVFASLTAPVLRGLNARVQVEGQDVRRVAADHLKAGGFL